MKRRGTYIEFVEFDADGGRWRIDRSFNEGEKAAWCAYWTPPGGLRGLRSRMTRLATRLRFIERTPVS